MTIVLDPSVATAASFPGVKITVTFPPELLDLEKRMHKRMPGTLRKIAIEGKSFWKSEAGRKLKTSRKAYQDAIDFEIDSGGLTFWLVLDGKLAYSVEEGQQGFDMKPGFLANATPPVGKRKFPRAVAETFGPKASKYRVIPLNIRRQINMTRPAMFRTVTDGNQIAKCGPNKGRPAWQHPGIRGRKISKSVIKELTTKIMPRHMKELLKSLSGGR